MRKQWAALGLVSTVLVACGDDEVRGAGSARASETGESSSSSESADEGSSSSESSSTGEPVTPPPRELEYARDIRLDRLTVNQAVQIEIVSDGRAVPPEDYNTRLIGGRRTLVRGFWKLHATFVPRELVGRLTIDYADGRTVTQDNTLHVEGPGGDGSATGAFQWLLEPSQVAPGMRVRAKILEPDPTVTDGVISTPPPIAPLEGPALLGLVDVPLEIEVVVVPILHRFEKCEQAPELTEGDLDAMRRELEQNNPVQRAIVTAHEPFEYTQSIAGGPLFTPVLSALAELRAADNPAPHVYYYGVMDSCDGFPGGLLGQAIVVAGPPTLENGQERIATGRWNGSGAAAAETFVHEIGHTQGRRHVQCSGGEGGIDTSYPHSNGRIGVWGFGIYDFHLRSPTGGRDYMTYCANDFVSDYGWEKTLDVIAVLTGFARADARPSHDGRELAGIVHEDGSADWWWQRGPATVPENGAWAELRIGDAVHRWPARTDLVPHSERSQYVRIPWPEGVEHGQTRAALELVTPEGRVAVPSDALTAR